MRKYDELTHEEKWRFDNFKGKLCPWQLAVLEAAVRIQECSEVPAAQLIVCKPRRSGKSLLQEYLRVLGINFVCFPDMPGGSEHIYSTHDAQNYHKLFGIYREPANHRVLRAIRQCKARSMHPPTVLYVGTRAVQELRTEWQYIGFLSSLQHDSSYMGLDIVIVSSDPDYIGVGLRT